jgi:hypothetical protein
MNALQAGYRVSYPDTKQVIYSSDPTGTTDKVISVYSNDAKIDISLKPQSKID